MVVYRELSSLTKDLGISAKTLYAVSNSLERHYHRISIPKKGGGERCLSVPDEVLKQIQHRIMEVLLAHMPISPCAMAYRYGGSAVRNAGAHVGNPMLLRLDIKGFFDSILYSTVKEKAFPPEIYAEPLRVLLAVLCYYRDSLPQGAPSSPAITNIILREFDDAVSAWCAERGITYTRYCDDMAFSGSFCAEEVTAFVRDRLCGMGMFLNESKTKYMHAGQQQAVTGIVVNEKMNVPADYRRKLRQELYFCRKYGVSEHLRRIGRSISPEAYLTQLYGRVNYVLQAAPEYREMRAYQTWLKEQLQRNRP